MQCKPNNRTKESMGVRGRLKQENSNLGDKSKPNSEVRKQGYLLYGQGILNYRGESQPCLGSK